MSDKKASHVRATASTYLGDRVQMGSNPTGKIAKEEELEERGIVAACSTGVGVGSKVGSWDRTKGRVPLYRRPLCGLIENWKSLTGPIFTFSL